MSVDGGAEGQVPRAWRADAAHGGGGIAQFYRNNRRAYWSRSGYSLVLFVLSLLPAEFIANDKPLV